VDVRAHLTCVGAIDNLVAILAAHPLDNCIETDVPLSSEFLCILNATPDAGDQLVLDMLSSARRTVGTLKLRCIAGGVPLGMGCARMPHFTSKKKLNLKQVQ
jgi:hypothetical protein